MPKSTYRTVTYVRGIVDARDAGRCQRCGRTVGEWFSRQHRIARGAGGSALVDRPSNIVTVCGSATSAEGCHNWMESDQRATAAEQGWVLPKLNPGIDTEQEPLFTVAGWVLLDDQGGIKPCPAPARATS